MTDYLQDSIKYDANLCFSECRDKCKRLQLNAFVKKFHASIHLFVIDFSPYVEVEKYGMKRQPNSEFLVAN